MKVRANYFGTDLNVRQQDDNLRRPLNLKEQAVVGECSLLKDGRLLFFRKWWK